MLSEQDRAFFYNYLIVIGLLVVMILVFLGLALYLGVDEDAIARKQATRISANTIPVGVVNIAGESAEEPAPTVLAALDEEPADMGERVYRGLCISCHDGLPGIPRVGDKAAWAGRIAQGMALLYEHAIKGFISEGGLIAMPAKGGNASLTDEEVRAAVDYMVAGSL